MTIHVDQARIAARIVDPTGTAVLQRRFRAEGQRRWLALRNLLFGSIVGQDLLGLRGVPSSVLSFGNPQGQFATMSAGQKVASFSDWLHNAQLQIILEGGGIWMKSFIDQAYQRGVHDAMSLLRDKPILTKNGDLYYELATTELHGIVDAIDQQATRLVAQALTEKRTPRQLFMSIADRISRVGINRFNQLVASSVIQAHANASLDVYEAAGRDRVVLIPEKVMRHRVQDAPRLKRRPHESEEEYEERRDRTQARRTIQRVKAAGGAIARAVSRTARKRRGESLSILTAGDADVCVVCERLARNEYTIREARGVLPAHNNCRCIWVTSNFAEEF